MEKEKFTYYPIVMSGKKRGFLSLPDDLNKTDVRCIELQFINVISTLKEILSLDGSPSRKNHDPEIPEGSTSITPDEQLGAGNGQVESTDDTTQEEKAPGTGGRKQTDDEVNYMKDLAAARERLGSDYQPGDKIVYVNGADTIKQKCKDCETLKKWKEFEPNPRMKTGYIRTCRKCKNDKQKNRDRQKKKDSLKTEETEYVCRRCKKKLSSRRELMEHINEKCRG